MRESQRKAVITGSASGIGKSIAQKFMDAGITTASCDIKENELTDFFYRTDLTQPPEVEEFCDKVHHSMGEPDILVCNAGRGIHQKLTEGEPDSWEDIFRLNVFSSFRLIRNFVPAMVNKQRGDVVFISSVSSSHAYQYGGIYSATKAAIDQLAETLRLEVQPEVRVLVVHPGVVDTNFFEAMISGTQTPEEIGFGSVHPDKVADAVFYALQQPRGLMLNDIVIRPTAQPM